jgi:ketosteroid isomerase-like protein
MKTLTNITSIIIIAVFLFSVGCQQQHDLKKLQGQVDVINDEIVKAILQNDSEGPLKFYTEDLVSLPSYQPMIKGMDALKAEAEKQKEMPMNMKTFNMNSTDLWASGKFVVEIGTYDLTMDWPDAPGGVWSDNGKYLTLYEIQEDGSLLIKAETWNTDTNPWQDMMKMQEEKKDKK